MNNDTSNIINNNDNNTYDTSYIEHNDMALALLNQPNRETRRKEMKKKYYNPHELNIGRISASSVNNTNQKQKKKQFNEFLKGKVK